MSYCRFSSMNWMCDVYCYADVGGGWTTHVASRRRAREPQPAYPDLLGDYEGWDRRYKQHMADLETIPLEDIGLPHDGESYNDSSLEAFRDRLIGLRDAGYNVPEYVFDEISEEISSNV